LSRKILVLSAVLLVAAMVVLIYADPVARLSLGAARPVGVGSTATRTFTFNSTFTFPSGNFTRTVGGAATDTNSRVFTLAAIAIAAVGLILEVVAIFLWPAERKPSDQPAADAGKP
jgi:hypothetical protein